MALLWLFMHCKISVHLPLLTVLKGFERFSNVMLNLILKPLFNAFTDIKISMHFDDLE